MVERIKRVGSHPKRISNALNLLKQFSVWCLKMYQTLLKILLYVSNIQLFMYEITCSSGIQVCKII